MSTMTSSSTTSQSDEPQELTRVGFGRKILNAWARLELDRHTVMLMMKGALPPTICLAIYEADSAAAEFGTVGYLMATISILGFAIMPRARFIQMMVLDVLAVCFAAAFALLMMYTCVKARQHTQSAEDARVPAGTKTAPYNTSASVVSGVWLFFQIYLVHSIRARFMQFQFPVIIYSIIANVSFTYAPRMATVPAAVTMVRKLLEVALTGLAISTGTCLFIMPTTSRGIVFKQMAGYIDGLRGTLRAHRDYFSTMEHDDMFGRADTHDSTIEKVTKKGKVYSPEAQAIHTAVTKLTELHAKLHQDLTFAKREIAYGKLGPDDLQTVFRHLRYVMFPVVGLGFVVEIFERLSDHNKWNTPLDRAGADVPDEVRERVVREWNEIMRAVHDPFRSMIQSIDEGLEHVLYSLELGKPPKKTAAAKNGATNGDDVEASSVPKPGDRGFAPYLERRLREFKVAKRLALRTWSEEKGIKLPPDFFERPSSAHGDIREIPRNVSPGDPSVSRDRSWRQLYLFLYMEQLLQSTGQVVLDFVRFADERVESGKLSKKHLIIPGSKRLLKWARSMFTTEDAHEDGNMGGDLNSQNHVLQLGEAYRYHKDPEHLPPETMFQRIGDGIRVIPALLRSSESSYGFRVACATTTIAVVAFISNTQDFFVRQRFVWAMIMVNLSMSPSAGQSIFGFVLRLLGTVLAMILSLLAWYIPGQKSAGVHVFLFVFLACVFYVPIKMFRFRIAGMITLISTAMVVGYELQVNKVGQEVAKSSGQSYYPTYLLAPYRLATVTGGIAVAFFWTFFPYPMSERSMMRQSLGASLYMLANYYSVIHETVKVRMRGGEGDWTLKTSAGRRLYKARNQVFSKLTLMLNGLRTYSEFQRWEVPVGGRFPKRKYDSIISCVENIVSYLSLLGYASDTLLAMEGEDESDTAWLSDLRRLVINARITTHEITSLLCLLSASISNGQPLPPYLKTPRPYSLSKRLEALDEDILSVRHIAEPGFATFSVLQISTRCIVGDVERLMKDVKSLVGELDFSFHAVSTAQSQSTKSSVDVPRSSRATDRDKME